MAKVHITTSSLLSVAGALQQYSSRMKEIASSMDNRVHSMESWSDTRAQQFVGQATMILKGLRLNMENFSRMSEFLRKYAARQEELDRIMKNKINNIR
ncbi:MAG: WXG100 family type VII secretion target [Akkermansia sp.]